MRPIKKGKWGKQAECIHFSGFFGGLIAMKVVKRDSKDLKARRTAEGKVNTCI